MISLPVPKSGGCPLDIRISSEVVPDLFTEKESHSDGVEESGQVIIHLQDRAAADEPTRTATIITHAPLWFLILRSELESYVS